jgi:hypothetical protein
MGGHIAETNNFVAEMAFGCAGTVGELVCGEPREKCFGGWLEGVAFLGDFKVAELAKDDLAGTYGCAVHGEVFEVCCFVWAVWTLLRLVEHVFMLYFTKTQISNYIENNTLCNSV